jgi:3-methyl-2-oxobutanoate hydroxymethyltransferase
VKVDAHRALAENVRAIVVSGIPVIAHIGLQASRRIEQSGYGRKGRTAEEAKRILDDAWAMAGAGVFAFVVEHVSAELMAHLTAVLPVPTISLGSGSKAHGVCIVSGDAVNYSVFPRPAHAGQFADLRVEIDHGLREYARQVRSGDYPAGADAPRMSPEENERFSQLMVSGKP